MDIKEIVVNELHSPARKSYTHRRVKIKGLNDLWEADLISMIPYERTNRRHTFILIVINAFSKFVWARPLKSKNSADVSKAMKSILDESKTPPRNLHTDRGKEFFNKDFKKLTDSYNINHYHTFSKVKASIVERVNRTLKNLMWKKFSMQGNYRWIDILDDIVQKYNNTVHSTIGVAPSKVTAKNEKHILNTAFSNIKLTDPKRNIFKVGDYVRISKERQAFGKGYTPNWSNEVFRIRKLQNTDPTTYLLEDDQNSEIKGGFYREELQLVKHPNIYLVEKILRRKGDKVYVKWLGMDKSHNSWISKKDVV